MLRQCFEIHILCSRIKNAEPVSAYFYKMTVRMPAPARSPVVMLLRTGTCWFELLVPALGLLLDVPPVSAVRGAAPLNGMRLALSTPSTAICCSRPLVLSDAWSYHLIPQRVPSEPPVQVFTAACAEVFSLGMIIPEVPGTIVVRKASQLEKYALKVIWLRSHFSIGSQVISTRILPPAPL